MDKEKKLNMFMFVFLLLILSLVLSGCGSQQGTDSTGTAKELQTQAVEIRSKVFSTIEAAPPESYVPNELIVKFRNEYKDSQTLQIHKAQGATVIKSLGTVGKGKLELIRLPEGRNLKEAMAAYMDNPSVEYAEPNYKRYIKATTPNDTYFSQQWALNNTGSFANGFAGADIKAPLAWDFSRGSDSLIVAVIDTGVDYNHEDLFGKIWINTNEICTDGIDNDGNGFVDDCYGWNFVNNNNNPMDDHGHGTHCAGIIGATTNNNLGIAGILWRVKIISLKFLSARGEGTVANAISALNYAVNMGARIVNASYGSSTYSQAEYDSISQANERRVLFIAAAGNSSENNDFSPHYPSSYGLSNIIAVSASDQRDNIATFSNFGPNTVDVAAPGVYILSLLPNDGYQNRDFWPGTSMATPHVVGLAGLIATQQEYVLHSFSIYQIRAIIESYVDPLTAFIGKIRTGGRINAFRSVTALLSPSNLEVTTSGPTSVDPLRVHLRWQINGTGLDNIRVERLRPGVDTNFVEIAQLSPSVNTYTDNSVVGETTYMYRVRGYKAFTQAYVPLSERTIYTYYTNTASVTTPYVPQHFSSGRGGCSVISSQSMIYASYDLIIPALFISAFIYLTRKRVK